MSSGRNAVVSGVVAAVIAIALVAAALYTPGLISRTSSAGLGTVGVQLTDPPTVPPGVTAVYISYSEMGIHVADAGNDSGWYQIAPAGEIDLMSILNTSITLGTSQVTTGVFNAVGFNITQATVTINGVNESAFISSDKMVVPLVGGLTVASGSNQGILVDLSPTVLAIQNGSETAYVLIPSAHSLYLPEQAWIHSEQRGDIIQNIEQNSWYHDMGQGEISVVHSQISANSMSVTVKNNGPDNTMISSLSVYYPLDVLCQQYPGSCSAAPIGDYLPRAIPVALFGVLSNSTLIQYNYTAAAETHYQSETINGMTTTGDAVSSQTSTGVATASETSVSASEQTVNAGMEIEIAEAQGVNVGYVLAPGHSVTFTFKGPIATIAPIILNYIHLSISVPQSLASAVSSINSGQQYYIVARGPFDTFGYEQVTAS